MEKVRKISILAIYAVYGNQVRHRFRTVVSVPGRLFGTEDVETMEAY